MHKTKVFDHKLPSLRRCIDFVGNITNCPSPLQSNFKDFDFSFVLSKQQAHAINNIMHLSRREKKSKDYFLVMPSVVVVLVSKNCFKKARCSEFFRDSCFLPFFSGFRKSLEEYFISFSGYLLTYMYEASFGACFTCAFAQVERNSSLKLSKMLSNHIQILAGNFLTFSSFLSSLLLFGSWILFDVKNIKEIEMNKRCTGIFFLFLLWHVLAQVAPCHDYFSDQTS